MGCGPREGPSLVYYVITSSALIGPSSIAGGTSKVSLLVDCPRDSISRAWSLNSSLNPTNKYYKPLESCYKAKYPQFRPLAHSKNSKTWVFSRVVPLKLANSPSKLNLFKFGALEIYKQTKWDPIARLRIFFCSKSRASSTNTTAYTPQSPRVFPTSIRALSSSVVGHTGCPRHTSSAASRTQFLLIS